MENKPSKTPLGRDQVAHIASLARLSFEPNELDHFTHQLQDIVAYADVILNRDFATIDAVDKEATLRTDDDVSELSANSAELLQNARELSSGAVKVPAIIVKEETSGNGA